jgi:hypothetical protein
LHKVDWDFLSSNTNANSLLERNLDKVDWLYVSENPNAVPILECNQDKINWVFLSGNPNAVYLCFTYDYLNMRVKMQPFAEELAKYVFHPLRLMRFCEKYEMELNEYAEIVG